MKQKNELNHNSDISQYLTIDSAEQANLRKLVADLIVSDDLNRPPIIDTLIGIVEKACPQSLKCPVFCDYAAVIIDSFMDYLLRVKSSCESELYHFFNWINHFPITPGTPFYPSFIRHISPEIESDPRVLENLNQLQLLYVFTEIKDWDNAYSLYEEIAKQVDRSILPLWVLLHICHVRILRHNNELKPFLNLELMLITESYSIDGSDSSLYFLIRWIIATKWQKQTILKKILLTKLYAKLGEQKSLNNAIVMFELFSLGDSLVPYAEKLNLQKKLIKFPPTILNDMQFHILYFFAGNVSTGAQSRFKESIANYQYSNYFQQNSWNRLLNFSNFMHDMLTPECFYGSIPFWEMKIKELSNQVSMQNNSYVESLQLDYAKIEELYEKVEELSLTDSLTGLRNRRYLDNNLYQMVYLAARHKVPVCFSMVDIDLFKLTNDSFGHIAGDFVLKELAKIITRDFRKSDIIVRFGGEEFLMVLFDSSVSRSYKMMEELRKTIETYNFVYRNHTIPVTVSIGIFCDNNLNPQTTNLNKFISNADAAMYKAKNTGRNRVVIYHSSKKINQAIGTDPEENPA